MSIFKNKKLCRNCRYFNSSFEMYRHTQGICKQSTITSAAFKADFISSENPIKVWWNFGCVRFEKKLKKI